MCSSRCSRPEAFSYIHALRTLRRHLSVNVLPVCPRSVSDTRGPGVRTPNYSVTNSLRRQLSRETRIRANENEAPLPAVPDAKLPLLCSAAECERMRG